MGTRSAIETLALVNQIVLDIIWGWPAMLLIVCTGIFLLIRLQGLPFRHSIHIFRLTLGCFGRRNHNKNRRADTVTPMQAMYTSLAATIGIGNITAVAGAITLGGPGAIFWMWISALLGMCIKYAEITLTIRFRQRNSQGVWVGGPMYFIKNGLGETWNWLSILFAILAAIAALGIGNLTQSHTIAVAVSDTVRLIYPQLSHHTLCLAVGIVLALSIGLILKGGMGRVARACSALVPPMALGYIALSIVVILANLERLPEAFCAIFTGAFRPTAVTGGAVGVTIQQAMKLGMARGIFSNESALGSASIGHAAADVNDPARQGFFGIAEVFVDTIVLCTMTALVILCGVGVENIGYGVSSGSELAIAGLRSVIPDPYASLLMTLFLFVFALSTILSWSFYGSRCMEFLLGLRVTPFYYAVFLLCTVMGSVMSLELAWSISDTLTGVMLIPNLIGILVLTPEVVALTRAHFAKDKP